MTDTKRQTRMELILHSRVFRFACIVLLVVVTVLRLMTLGSAASGDDPIPVSVRYKGQTTLHIVTATTVKEALEQAEYEVGVNTIVRPDLNETIEEGDIITILSMGDTYTMQEEIPYETHITYSPEVKPRTQEVRVEGEVGITSRTYTLVSENGKEEEVLLSETVLSDPIHEEIVAGFPTKTVSPLDFGYTFDENFVPMNYKDVLTNQKATAYYANDGAKTSTGRTAQVGYVAVNPNEIPYGSKMFITSPDGGFIYGYAIAADTGSDLMANVIDVDLYYNSYEDCVRHGVKRVNIYIL